MADRDPAAEPPPAEASADGDVPPDFEAALAELDELLERMEGGDLPLDASLAAFERGIRLTRHCQKALAEAEQRVRVLLEQDDGTLATAPAELGDTDPGAATDAGSDA